MGSQRRNRPGHRCSRKRRGVATVFFLASVMTMLAMAMIVIDLGYMRVVHGELQSAADAASLAAMQALDMDADAARHVAEEFAELNQAAGAPVFLDRQDDVVFGTYDEKTGTISVLEGSDEAYADAVQITVHVSDVPFFLAPLAGFTKFGLSATSTARYKAASGGNIVGLKKVELKNDAFTDSYNSSLGDYSVETATSEGGVSSNEEIKVDSATVNGDAFLPFGEKLDVGGGGFLTGERIDLPEPLNYPEVDYSEVVIDNNNDNIPLTHNEEIPYDGEKLVVKSDDTLDLPPGAYYFKEVKLEEDATINISDQTRIFVEKKIDAEKGQLNNPTKTPSNLQLNSTLDNPLDEIKLPKNYDFHGMIYAPSAKVTKKGESHIYGAVIANELKIEGGAVHADRALMRAERGTGAVAILVD